MEKFKITMSIEREKAGLIGYKKGNKLLDSYGLQICEISGRDIVVKYEPANLAFIYDNQEEKIFEKALLKYEKMTGKMNIAMFDNKIYVESLKDAMTLATFAQELGAVPSSDEISSTDELQNIIKGLV